MSEIQPTAKEEQSLATTSQVDNFLVQWNSWRKMATEMLKSNFLPPIYKTPEQVMVVLLKGRELNIPPMEALGGLYPLNGRVGMEGKLMLSLVRRSGLLESIEINHDETVKECTVIVKRKGENPFTSKFSMLDAQRAGLGNKDNWKNYPRDMLQWRAIARNLRITFPDIISGVYLPEEIQSGNAEAEEIGVEVEEDSDMIYQRLHSSLMTYAKEPTKEATEAWVEMYKDDMEKVKKLSPKKFDVLNRMFIDIQNKLSRKEVSNGGQPIRPNGLTEQQSKDENAQSKPVN